MGGGNFWSCFYYGIRGIHGIRGVLTFFWHGKLKQIVDVVVHFVIGIIFHIQVVEVKRMC